MSFQDALHVVSRDLIYKLLLPDWTLSLTQRSRLVRDSCRELEVCKTSLFSRPTSDLVQRYMSEMIDAGQSSGKGGERADLFSLLIAANELEEKESPLSRRELMSEQSVCRHDL